MQGYTAMSAQSIDIRGHAELDKALRDYVRLSGKTVDEVLAKKGNDLRIQLFRGFYSKRLARGASHQQMLARSRSGRGTLTRWKTLGASYIGNVPDSATGAPLNKQQALVWQELQRRDKGAGVLGTAFLIRRRRSAKAGSYLARNTSRLFGTLAEVEQRESLSGETPEGSFRVSGYAPGQAAVARRYGIETAAIAAVLSDIRPYLQRKQTELLTGARLR